MHTLILLAMLSGLAITPSTTTSANVGFEAQAAHRLAERDVQALALRIEGMSTGQQMAAYFGAQPSSSRLDSVSRGRSAYSLDRFAADPALRGFGDIEASWLLTGAATDGVGRQSVESLLEAKILVARNLFLEGETKATVGSVESQLSRLRQYRERYAATPLFRGRSVVFAASDDKHSDGRHQFGRLANQVLMKRDASAFYFLRGKERSGTGGSDFELKDLLAREENLTFVFEGHGREKALKLAGGLSVRKLAGWLAARPAELPPPILILDACRSHDFARHLLAEMAGSGSRAALPIIVVPDEYGQSLVKDVYSGAFLRRGLAAARDASIGSAMRNGSRRMSIYVPDDQQQPLQIG